MCAFAVESFGEAERSYQKLIYCGHCFRKP
jgi:hypothetical protein